MDIRELMKFVANARYLKGMLKRTEASVESIENPAEDYYVVKLKTADEVSWLPGEHAMFTLPFREVEGVEYRIFSVASVPEEGVMLLGMRTGKTPSSFKRELLSMKKGEKVSIRGPFGWFRIRDATSPVVLFASGVGITPVRALMKQLEEDRERPVAIVYASRGYYLFEEELEEIVRRNPKMILYRTRTSGETQEKLAELAAGYGNQAYYYISGAPAVLDSVRSMLRGKGIRNKRIIDDTLKGY